MDTWPTPDWMAWTQPRTLGAMPPAMRPASISSMARFTSMWGTAVLVLWLSMRMPPTSVRNTSFWALSASATARAASSALQFRPPPSSPRAMGEMTGRKPASSRVVMSLVSTRVISPTRPRAGSFTVAVMRPPSLPDTPTADTFCRANS